MEHKENKEDDETLSYPNSNVTEHKQRENKYDDEDYYDEKSASFDPLPSNAPGLARQKSVKEALGLTSTWACEVCSFENPRTSGNCAMCLSERPDSADPVVNDGPSSESQLHITERKFDINPQELRNRAEIWQQGADALQRALVESELAELSGCPELRPTASLIHVAGESGPHRVYVDDYVPTSAEQEESARVLAKLYGDSEAVEGLSQSSSEFKSSTADPKPNQASQPTTDQKPEWDCPVCTFKNPHEAPICAVCETQSPVNTQFSPLLMNSDPNPVVVAKVGEWVCTQCTMINPISATNCQVCEHPSELKRPVKTSQASAQVTAKEQLSTDVHTSASRAGVYEQQFARLENMMGDFVFLDSEPIVNLLSYALAQLDEDESQTDRYLQPILDATGYRASTIAELRGFLAQPRIRERIMTLVFQDKPPVLPQGGVAKRLNPLVYTRLYSLAKSLGTDSTSARSASNSTETKRDSDLGVHGKTSNTTVASLDALMQATMEQEHAFVLRAHEIFSREQELLLAILKCQGEFIQGVYETVATHVATVEAAAQSLKTDNKTGMSLFRAAAQILSIRSDANPNAAVVNYEFLRRFGRQLNLTRSEVDAIIKHLYGAYSKLPEIISLHTTTDLDDLRTASGKIFEDEHRGESSPASGWSEAQALLSRVRSAFAGIESKERTTSSESKVLEDAVFETELTQRMTLFRQLTKLVHSPTVRGAAEYIAARMRAALLPEEASNKKKDEFAGLTEAQKRHLINEGFYMQEDATMAKNRAYMTGRHDQVVIKNDQDTKSKKDKKDKKDKKEKAAAKLLKKPKKGEVGFGFDEYAFDDSSPASISISNDTKKQKKATKASTQEASSDEEEKVEALAQEEQKRETSVKDEAYVQNLIQLELHASHEKSLRRAKIGILAEIIRAFIKGKKTAQSLHFLSGVRIRLGLTRADELLALSSLGHTLKSFQDSLLSATPQTPMELPTADDEDSDKVYTQVLTGHFRDASADLPIIAHIETELGIAHITLNDAHLRIKKWTNYFVTEGFMHYLETIEERNLEFPPQVTMSRFVYGWFPIFAENTTQLFECIQTHGFRREYMKAYPSYSVGEFGNGILFYTNLPTLFAETRKRSSKPEYLILAQIAPGAPTKPSPNSWPGFRVAAAGITYDSFVDNADSPTKIMIFDDFQALPIASVKLSGVDYSLNAF